MSFAYLLLVFAAYALLLIFAGLDNAIRTRDARSDNLDALSTSRVTIPVSILVPSSTKHPSSPRRLPRCKRSDIRSSRFSSWTTARAT